MQPCLTHFELIDLQWNYLKEMEKPFVHLEPLAIIFSLTYALLMWSCVFSNSHLTFSV
jgi:hypothetical protein